MTRQPLDGAQMTALNGLLLVGDECPLCTRVDHVASKLRAATVTDDEEGQKPLRVLYCPNCWLFWMSDEETP